MKNETLTKYKNKKVRLYLVNGKVYTGRIISVSDDVCELIDKFSLHVAVSNNSIQQVELLEDKKESEQPTGGKTK